MSDLISPIITETTRIDISASHRIRLGCSKIAQALGVSRFGSQYQLWEQYTGRVPWPDISSDLRVALGEPMESVLQPFVEQRIGRNLRRDRKEYLHPELPLIGHVDYRATATADEPKRPVVDMKTSLGWGAKNRFGDDGTDAVDEDVALQMQGYMLLTGAATAYVAALVPGPTLKIFTIQAEQELQRMIEEGVEEFWQYVITDTPPPPATLDDAKRRWPSATSKLSVTATTETVDAVQQLRELKSAISELKTEADALELRIKTELGDAEELLAEDGKRLCTWKNQRRTSVDSAHLKTLHPEIYDAVATVTTARVFRLGA